MKDGKPTMNDFFVRGISVNVALEAIEQWDALTDEQKIKLGFSGNNSSLDDFLGRSKCAEVIRLVSNNFKDQERNGQ